MLFLFWSSLVCFVCVCFLSAFCLFLSVSYETHCFPCNSSILGLMFIQSLSLISVSGSCFLFLFCLLYVSRWSFVCVFLLAVLLCFES